MKNGFPPDRMRPRTTYRWLCTIRDVSYGISNRMGTLPGCSMRARPITSAGASAFDTSSSVASNTASAGIAIRSRYVAVPFIWADADSVGANRQSNNNADASSPRDMVRSPGGVIGLDHGVPQAELTEEPRTHLRRPLLRDR